MRSSGILDSPRHFGMIPMASAFNPAGRQTTPAASANVWWRAVFIQVELAAERSILQRMVACCESLQAAPAATLLPSIANAPRVSIDELFGRTVKRRLPKQGSDSRLRRRLLAIEKLEPVEKHQVLQLRDALIKRVRLKRQAEERHA